MKDAKGKLILDDSILTETLDKYKKIEKLGSKSKKLGFKEIKE